MKYRFSHLVVALLFSLVSFVSFSQEKIGIYSGTFDPIHLGHLNIVDTAIREQGLDKVYIYPNLGPSGKKTTLSFDDRYELVKKAIKDHAYIVLPPKEKLKKIMDDKDPHTRMSNWIFNSQESDDAFFRIMGTDSFHKFNANPSAVAQLNERKNMDLIIVKRKGENVSRALKGKKRFHFVNPRLTLDFSSSRYRSDPLLYEATLPREVAREISKKGWYGRGKERGFYDLPESLINQLYLEQLQNERIEDLSVFASIQEDNGLDLRYMPESRPSFYLHSVLLDEAEVVKLEGGGTIPSGLKIKKAGGGFQYEFLIHPESLSFFKQKLKGKKIEKKYLATPTSSHRSLIVWNPRNKKKPMGIKVTLNVDIGEVRRLLTKKQMELATAISRLVGTTDQRELKRRGVVFINEPFSFYPANHPYGLSYREIPKLDDGAELMPMFSLYSRPIDGSDPPIVKMMKESKLPPREFAQKFIIEPMISQQAFLAFSEGLVGEPHEQNVLIEIKKGKPTGKFYYRDLGGFSVNGELRTAAGKDLSFLGDLPKESLKMHRANFVDNVHVYLRKANFFSLTEAAKGDFPEINKSWMDKVFRKVLFDEMKKYTGTKPKTLSEAEQVIKAIGKNNSKRRCLSSILVEI